VVFWGGVALVDGRVDAVAGLDVGCTLHVGAAQRWGLMVSTSSTHVCCWPLRGLTTAAKYAFYKNATSTQSVKINRLSKLLPATWGLQVDVAALSTHVVVGR
jgi:hypothetical protein